MKKFINEITDSNFSIGTEGVGDVVEGTDDVLLCISNLVMTPKGDIPSRHEKGSGIFDYQDKPISLAIPGIVASVYDSIEKWEPRVSVVSIENSVDESLGHVRFTVNLKLIQTSENFQYEFDFNYKSPSGRAFSDGFSNDFQ